MAQGLIGALRVTLGMDSAAFEKGLKNSRSKLQNFGKMAAKGMLVVGAAAAAAAGGIAVAVSGTIDAADEMSKAAQKIGIPIEELSRLKYAADLSGVSFGALQNGVKRLSANMNDAANGIGEAKDAFEQLGISVTNSDGSLKTATQVMAEMADKFQAMPDGAEKTALAMDIMGKSGADMIPLLNGGTEALNKLLGEADTFGQVFTQEMGSAAEAFNDNMSRLKGALANLAAELTQRLLPYLEKFSAWLVENAPAIANSIGNAIDKTAELFGRIGDTYRMMSEAFNTLVSNIQSIPGRVQAIADQIVAAFAALPGQMVEIGIQMIEGLWQGIQQKWAELKERVANLGNDLVQGIKDRLGIKSPSKVMYGVGVDTMEGLALGMESMAARIDGIVGSSASGIEGAFSGIGSAIAGLIKGTSTWQDVLSQVLSQLTQVLFSSNALQQVFGVGGGVGGFFSSLLGGLFGFANGGSFKVGGIGGIDSQVVAFRASPNETVSVTKPGQMAAGASGMGVHVTVGWSDTADGNLKPFVESVSQGEIRRAAPAISDATLGRVDDAMPGMLQKAQRRSL